LIHFFDICTASNTIIILKRRKTSVVLMFKAFNLEGVIAISYCFKYPPQVFISTTPFIPDNGALQPSPE
jgi:hypothetical protein